MNTDDILRKIEDGWFKKVQANPKVIALQKKVTAGKANYDDLQQLAIETGNILADMFRRYLPEALEDGKLYKEIAEKLITRPLLKSGKLLQDDIRIVQEAMNQHAGLNLSAVVPGVNMSQVHGIVKGVSKGKPFINVQEKFYDQVTNCMQCLVDDAVRENAAFHWKAGLDPVIRRTVHGKCCPWCEAVAGTYDYARVRDKGNDVFRRHRNCRCLVEYDPGDGKGKYQNVHTKRWEDHAEVPQKEQPIDNPILPRQDVRKEYFKNRQPGNMDFDDRFDHSVNEEEEKMARYIHQLFGGEIHCLNHNLYSQKSPDYIWNGKLWELKTTSTAKAADSAVRSGLKQISGPNAGGIIIDITSKDVYETIHEAEKRLKRSLQEDIDVIYIHNSTVVEIFRYEK